MTLSTISAQEYALFTELIEKATGIVIGENKEYLVISRLKNLEICNNVKNYHDLLNAVTQDMMLKEKIIDAMTTNETSWYRDVRIFNCFEKKILPAFLKTKINKLRIWSAACSTGQEPYSISMCIQDYVARHSTNNTLFEIVGTDISKEVLDKAKAGRYEEILTVKGLSELRKNQYFFKKEQQWEISEKIKRRVKFEFINLMNNFSNLGKFDIIFCRNVLIYFSEQVKLDVINRMAKQLNEGGYLILGGSETMANYAELFEMKKIDSAVIYKLKT